MFRKKYSRREFIRRNTLTGMGAFFAMNAASKVISNYSGDIKIPAILGGVPVRTKGWTEWPVWTSEDEKFVVDVLRKGNWSRAYQADSVVHEFEREWAGMLGVKRCLALVNGTNALITSMRMMNIGGGDEVIVTPYTFIATISSIIEVGAMPVFADVDPETFQIDPVKIEEKITPRTRAILPVHILGLPADITRIMEIARKHNLVVIEDACQAWLAEVNHRKLGTFGNAGCFSFQVTKHLSIGEGGAIVSDNEEFMDMCYSYHDTGRPYGKVVDPVGGFYVMRGNNLRMTSYQAAIGLTSLRRLEEHTTLRSKNAEYLKSKVSGIPGILPYKLYDNVTRAAFHLFPFRYKKEEFNDLSRAEFLRALNAEGIPSSGGYTGKLNMMPYLDDSFMTKNYQLMYPKRMLNYERFVEKNRCPQSERLSDEEGVWIFQSLLLGRYSDMDDIYDAIEKIHSNSAKIKAGLKA